MTHPSPASQNASQTLDQEYLGIRCKLLEIAAALDRIHRAEGNIDADPRMRHIQESLRTLLRSEEGSAEKVQMIYSLPYQPSWRSDFGIE